MRHAASASHGRTAKTNTKGDTQNAKDEEADTKVEEATKKATWRLCQWGKRIPRMPTIDDDNDGFTNDTRARLRRQRNGERAPHVRTAKKDKKAT